MVGDKTSPVFLTTFCIAGFSFIPPRRLDMLIPGGHTRGGIAPLLLLFPPAGGFMHRQTWILAAACSVVCADFSTHVCRGQARQVPAQAVAPAAAEQADVPVRQFVLYSSGVGYFEHFGSVKGDASTELRFKTDQINDVLKSLVLQDMDGGKIVSVSYSGQAPLAHKLKSFQVDITANPNMAELLNQLRGAKITLTLGADKSLSGVVVGVENKVIAAGEKGGAIETSSLNLKAGHEFRSIPLSEIHAMVLDDPKLEKELDDALDAVAQSRDQDKKPVTIHFRGAGDRRVRIGYVVETPIWKTSYRLVLGANAGPTTAPAAKDAIQPKNDSKLQGWAIVENQTDNDWKDIQLSLMSGRPLSFIQDLYHAMYIPRPVVQPDLYASLFPQTYSGGMSIKDLTLNVPDFTDAPDAALNSTNNNAAKQQAQGGGGVGGNGLFGGGAAGANAGGNAAQAMDPTASIISAASAAKVGELFQYTVGNVSLERQKSAMIPIITDDVDAERISIYNEVTLATHPLLGARLRNNTKKYLLQGPITVLDRGTYAGDARVEDLPPGQSRLISYGIDQQVLVDPSDKKQNLTLVTGTLLKGVLHLDMKTVMQDTYVVNNKSDEVRQIIIEQQRAPGWTLTAPKQADEITSELFRFKRTVEAHKAFKISIEQEVVNAQLVELMPAKADDLVVYTKNESIPQSVRDALNKAIKLKNDQTALRQQITAQQAAISEVSLEQARIRENMKTVAAETDYYKRLLKKLDEQETGIEKVQKELADTRAAADAQQKQLDAYLITLTVQ
jgi:hypothetical protein